MKTVVIVGVGALGSHVAQAGRNWPVQLKLIDFDRIEQKNVQAQFHARPGIRQNKAQSLSRAMLGMFGTKVLAVPHKLTEANAEALLGGSELVIDCTHAALNRKVEGSIPSGGTIMGRSSSGQDTGLSRRRPGFDSPSPYHRDPV